MGFLVSGDSEIWLLSEMGQTYCEPLGRPMSSAYKIQCRITVTLKSALSSKKSYLNQTQKWFNSHVPSREVHFRTRTKARMRVSWGPGFLWGCEMEAEGCLLPGSCGWSEGARMLVSGSRLRKPSDSSIVQHLAWHKACHILFGFGNNSRITLKVIRRTQ